MSTPVKESLLSSATTCVRLHQGGEADVYLLCLDNGERLILKWYHQSFHTESVEKIQKIKDDGICRIREAGSYEGTPYQLYDYVEGISSDGLEAMPVIVALKALRQLVFSLQMAVKAGVSHGDLNPANVIFTTKDSKGIPYLQPVLIDWGISGPGALSYAAPERFQGKAPDEKSDIFSLGMLLYRWLMGKNLVEASSFDEYASRNSQLEAASIGQQLLLSGKFTPKEISALDSLWDVTLACSSEDRSEDLDELDELLEIALEALGGGEISLDLCIKNYLAEIAPMVGKVGQNVSDSLEKALEPQFPYKNSSAKKCRNSLKIAILCGIGILVLVIVFVITTGTETPDVDETGKIILKNSRSLDLDYVRPAPLKQENQDDVPVQKLLNDLPMPSKE